MRTGRVLVLAGVAGLSLVAGDAAAGGREKKSAAYTVAGASVTLPDRGYDRRDAESKEVAFGPRADQACHLDSCGWYGDDVQYTLTVVTLPLGLRGAPKGVMLAGAKKGLLEPAGQGTVLEVEDTKLVSLPAGLSDCMALNIRAGSRRIRARVVVYDGRVYQLTAVGPNAAVDSDAVTAALDTFRVTGPPGV